MGLPSHLQIMSGLGKTPKEEEEKLFRIPTHEQIVGTQEVKVSETPETPETPEKQNIFGKLKGFVKKFIPEVIKTAKVSDEALKARFKGTYTLLSNQVADAYRGEGVVGKLMSIPTATYLVPKSYREKMANQLGELAKKTQDSALKDMKVVEEYLKENPLAVDMDGVAFKEKMKDPEFVARGLTLNAPSLLAGLGISTIVAITTKNPVLAYTAAFGTGFSQEAGESYNDAIKEGVTEKDARTVGMIVGTINGFLEGLFPGSKAVDLMGSKVIKQQFFKELTTTVIKDVLKEGSTEALQEIVSNVGRSTYEDNVNLLQGTKEAAFFGALMGGITSINTTTYQHLRSAGVKVNEDVVEELAEPEKIIIGEEAREGEKITEATKGVGGVSKIGKWIDSADKGGIPNETPEMVFKDKNNKTIAGLFQNGEGGWIIQRKGGTYLYNPETKTAIFDSPELAQAEFIGKEIPQNLGGVVEKIPPTNLAKKTIKTQNGDWMTAIVDKKTGKPLADVSTSPEWAKDIMKNGLDKDLVHFKENLGVVEGGAKPVKTEIKAPREIIQLQEKVIEKKIKTTRDIKGVRDTLKSIRQDLDNTVTEAEGRAVMAAEQRRGLNVEDINHLKRIYALNKKFQEGDIETIRASRSGPLLNRVLENIQEKYPNFSEQEAFDFAVNLPTKTDEKIRTSEIAQLEKKEKQLRKYMDQLKTKQKELNIEENTLLTKEWESVLAAQEKLTRLIRVPETQLPIGEGVERVSRLEARVKDALGKITPEEQDILGLSTYRQMNKADQMAKASKYVAENTDEAMKVLKGDIESPTGILRNSIYVALKELGSADTQVATQIASLASTRLGQEISILSEIDKDSPVSLMEDVVKARIEGYKRRGKDLTESVKHEGDKISIDKPGKADWDSFLASIRC